VGVRAILWLSGLVGAEEFILKPRDSATICLCFSLALAQERLEFEVASLKPAGPKSVRDFGGGPGSKDPGLYHANSASLRDLIANAWNVDYFQISSGTPLDRQNFDLAAKVPRGATKEQFRAMLQNLLRERFGLKVHMERKQFPAYELVVAKTGLKLKEAVAGDRPGMTAKNSASGGYLLVSLKSQEEPLSILAMMLHVPDGAPVLDKTGLPGKYTFSLEYTMDLPGAVPDAPPIAPGLSSALQEQLGLQLVSKKLPFDVVVVEAFNKLPTEN
jgi:uncharacterized protein (TIGR03435 family)